MKILKSEDFYWPKSSRTSNYQTWIFHDVMKNNWEILKNLIAKRDFKEDGNPNLDHVDPISLDLIFSLMIVYDA